MSERVAVIGLGRIGGPMAGHLHRAGLLAAVYDPHPERLAPLGTRAAPTPAAAAAAGEIVLIPLGTGVRDLAADATEAPTSDYVEGLLFGPEGILAGARPGALIIDMTTGDPRRTRRLAPLVRERGCEFIDSPISGAEARARDATLSVMTAGPRAAYERALPVLRHLGTEIRHVGPLGAGHTAKLLQNLLTCMNAAALAEVTALAERAGLDRETFVAVANAGVGASHVSRVKGPRMVQRAYADSVDQVYYQAEVIRLCLGIGREHGAPTRLAEAVALLFGQALDQGLAAVDTAALVEMLAPGEQVPHAD